METLAVRQMKAAIAAVEVDRPNDRRVLTEIARFSLNEGGAFPSYKTLAERLALGVSTVRQAVYRLLNRGLVVVRHRFRKDGSQTSNKYSLKLPKGALCSTPLNTRDPSASSDTPLSGGRARRARQNIKSMIVIGALDDEPTAPEKPRWKSKVKSGNEEVTRTVEVTGAVHKPSRKEIDGVCNAIKLSALREEKPTEEWSALDFAHHWRQRLWDIGVSDYGKNLNALIKHFRTMLDDGTEPAELRAMTDDFFEDPRNWTNVRGPLIWRAFIGSRGQRLWRRKNDFHQRAHYAIKPLPGSSYGTIRLPRSMRDAD